jgi:hypothetical protein
MKGLAAVLGLLFALGVFFFLYRSGSPPQEMAETEIAQIEAAVMEGMAAYVDGYREMDLVFY